MKPKITKDKADFFQLPLEWVINQEHPLVQLSREFERGKIRREIAVNFLTPTVDLELKPKRCLDYCI